jgi:hypothetical protein
MKLLTNAFTATLIASAALVPTPAEAQQQNGWDYCTTYETLNLCANSGQTYDTIQVNGTNQGVLIRERLHIQCSDNGWSYASSGTMTKEMANSFAEGYCGGRGTPHPYVNIPSPNSSTDPVSRDMTGRAPQVPQTSPRPSATPAPAPAPTAPPKDGFLF